jgi:hypothetical protein
MANITKKAMLYSQNVKLRSVYIYLLRREHFDTGIFALYKEMRFLQKSMMKYLPPTELSLLVSSLTGKASEEVINFAFTWLGKEEYAEFFHYIVDESWRDIALEKGND